MEADQMESTKLEAQVELLQKQIDIMQRRLDELRDHFDARLDSFDACMDGNFRWIVGLLFAILLAVVGTLFRGLH